MGEVQVYWHLLATKLSDYESWEEMRAHQRMWLGRVGKQQWTQWDDVLLTEYYEALRGLMRVQEDEAKAVDEARSNAGNK